MSLPEECKSTFLPSEIFFLAEDEPVVIIPRQNIEPVKLIGADTPRLRLQQRTEVPLWYALLLKKQSKCSIVLPLWMEEDNLKITYEQEKNSPYFSALPWRWIELSQSLLTYAADDFVSPPHSLRSLLRDIREIRQAKARSGLQELNESHLRMDNLGHMEINELRPLVVGAMTEISKLRPLPEEE